MLRIVLCIVTSFLFVQLEASGQHFSDCVTRTGANATFLMTSEAAPTLAGEPLASNVEVAAFSQDGLCSGVGTWNGSELVISVWGDDSQTHQRDGITNGQHFNYRLWDPATESELNASNADITVTYDPSKSLLSTDGRFVDGAILHVRSFDVAIKVEEPVVHDPEVAGDVTLHESYPNPASESTVIGVSLPESAVLLLEVFDTLGRRVAEIVSRRRLPSGHHSFPFDVAGIPSGLYFLRLKVNGRMHTRTLHVVRD